MGVRDTMLGHQFGNWTVVAIDDRPKRVIARCACGVETSVTYYNLRTGQSTQCVRCARSTHRKTATRAHRAWVTMRKSGDFAARWDDFVAFESDMGSPAVGERLHRPDPSRPWGPGNAVWMALAKAIAICNARRADRMVGTFQLSKLQRKVLRLLAQTGPIRLTVIARLVGHPVGALSHCLPRLRRRGLVRNVEGAWGLTSGEIRR